MTPNQQIRSSKILDLFPSMIPLADKQLRKTGVFDPNPTDTFYVALDLASRALAIVESEAKNTVKD